MKTTMIRLVAAVLVAVSTAGCGGDIVYHIVDSPRDEDNIPAGILETVAGTGFADFTGDGGLATEATLNNPGDVWADAAGNFYIADNYNWRIRRVDGITGIIETVVLNVNRIRELVMTAAGDFIFLDLQNSRVRKAKAFTGEVSDFLGQEGNFGFNGDGMDAADTLVNRAHGLALDGAGNLFIADFNNGRIRRVDAVTNKVSTVAGIGIPDDSETIGFSGDGGPAIEAKLNLPSSGVFDLAGNYIFADAGNRRVRKIDVATGIITTIAGTGENADSGDGGLATEAAIKSPRAVAVDGAGNIYIADAPSQRIRRIDAVTGIITTAAGTGEPGYSGDGGPATEAMLNQPQGLEVDRARNLLYICDSGNHVVRRMRLPD